MAQRRRYRKKADQYIIAVQLNLVTSGFTYHKWHAEQRAKAGDWLVNNHGDIYTVDKDVFERTYREVQPGYFVKTTPIWAEVASEAGSVKTKEDESYYKPGDYLVSNNEDGSDAYCISAQKFELMYEVDD